MAFHENHWRSILKALSYRALIICSDSLIVFVITRRADITLGFVTVSNIFSTILYFFHERAWNQVHWGKQHIKHIDE